MTGSRSFGVRSAIAIAVLLLATACTGGESTTPTSSSTTTNAPVITDPPPVIDERPAAPVGLTVVATTDGSIALAWEASRSADVTGYELTRVSPGGVTRRVTVDGIEYVDSDVAEDEIYTYSVAAVGPGGTSSGSDSVTARMGVDENPPSVPGRPQVVQSDEASVVLEWRPSRDISGVANYVVSRTVDGITDQLLVEEPSFADDIAAGVVATYAVSAVDIHGNQSAAGRSITLLSGKSTDEIVIVVSAVADPATDPHTDRLHRALLDEGYVVSWFDDRAFDSNVTDSGDVVLLLGDVEADGFDWNIFGTDATVIGLKSMYFEAAGITDDPPKLDRLAQLDYTPPGGEVREVILTRTGRPKPVVYIPENEQIPSLQVWGRPVWSNSIAVVGLIEAGDELANEKPARGCRAFFPGNSDSLAEQTDAGWDLLIEFVGAVADACA